MTTPDDPHADPDTVAVEILRRMLHAEWIGVERNEAEGRAWRTEAVTDSGALLRRLALLNAGHLPTERLVMALVARCVSAYAALGRLLDCDPREMLDAAERYAADDPDVA